MNTKPILFIAGATGLLGAKLVDAALNKDLAVRALVRDLKPNSSGPLQHVVRKNLRRANVE